MDIGANRRSLRRLLLCGSATLALVILSDSVEAAEADQPPIVITGSRIPRRNLTATSPVTLVDKTETKFQGTTNVEDLLNSLPQVQPGFNESSNNGATGTATVDLRSLSPGRTLVLINGRRMAPGDPRLAVPDINMIPSTLIGRVEILTGGASSVYGSDAIAGVVNFILDTSLEGIRLDAQTSFLQHDNNTKNGLRAALDEAGFRYPTGNTIDGGRQNINGAIGKSFLGGRGHVTLYGGYRHISGLTQDARDYSACNAQIDRADNTVLFCGGSPAAYPGNFINGVDEVFTLGPGRTFVPGSTLFNFAPYNYYQRPDRRYTAGGFADIEISDAIKPYLEVMYLNDLSVAQIAPSGDFGYTQSTNCDNPLLSAQQLSHVCFDGNFIGQEDGGNPVTFTDPVTGNPYFRAFLFTQRRLIEAEAREQELRHENLRLVGGIGGDVAKGVSYDASYIRTKATMNSRDSGFLSKRRMRNALDVIADPATGQPACRKALTGEDPNCVPWDIFEIGGVTQAAIDYLSVEAQRHGSVTEKVANFNSTLSVGEWGIRSPWAEDGPSINVGAEYRKDKLSYVPDPLQFTGDLGGAGDMQLPVSGATEVKELFAEGRVPIVNRGFLYEVALEGGYRQSWYSNAEDKVSSNSYKVALEAEPVRGVRFRGSLQRAVRAPNVIELFSPVIEDDSLGDDPCAGVAPDATLSECERTGVTAAQYGHIVKLVGGDFSGYNSIAGGNTSLAPETATTKTAGIVLEPRFIPGLTATVDWWDIKVKGAIGALFPDDIMANCLGTGDSTFCSRIHRDSRGSLWLTPDGFVDGRNFNFASLNPAGIDIGVNYDRSIRRVGVLNLNFLGTYTYRWHVDFGGLSEAFDCSGEFGGDCGTPTPRWRHKARLTWTTRDKISVSINWRFYSAEKLAPPGTPGPYSKSIPAQSFFDVGAIVPVASRYSFRIGVNNLFDHEPPLVPEGAGNACSGGCSGNTYAQFFDPTGRYVFAGVTLNLKPY